jgi:hypothetical protein
MEAPGIRKSLERLIYRMKAMVAGSEHRESKQVWVRMCVVCVCVCVCMCVCVYVYVYVYVCPCMRLSLFSACDLS